MASAFQMACPQIETVTVACKHHEANFPLPLAVVSTTTRKTINKTRKDDQHTVATNHLLELLTLSFLCSDCHCELLDSVIQLDILIGLLHGSLL